MKLILLKNVSLDFLAADLPTGMVGKGREFYNQAIKRPEREWNWLNAELRSFH